MNELMSTSEIELNFSFIKIFIILHMHFIEYGIKCVFSLRDFIKISIQFFT